MQTAQGRWFARRAVAFWQGSRVPRHGCGYRYNDGEARCIVALAQALLDAGLAATDLGVITPYSAQRSRCVCALKLQLFHVSTRARAALAPQARGLAIRVRA